MKKNMENEMNHQSEQWGSSKKNSKNFKYNPKEEEKLEGTHYERKNKYVIEGTEEEREEKRKGWKWQMTLNKNINIKGTGMKHEQLIFTTCQVTESHSMNE